MPLLPVPQSVKCGRREHLSNVLKKEVQVVPHRRSLECCTGSQFEGKIIASLPGGGSGANACTPLSALWPKWLTGTAPQVTLSILALRLLFVIPDDTETVDVQWKCKQRDFLKQHPRIVHNSCIWNSMQHRSDGSAGRADDCSECLDKIHRFKTVRITFLILVYLVLLCLTIPDTGTVFFVFVFFYR